MRVWPARARGTYRDIGYRTDQNLTDVGRALPLGGRSAGAPLVVLVEVKSSQVISAHSLPPLLAAGAHSTGFRMGVNRMGVCC